MNKSVKLNHFLENDQLRTIGLHLRTCSKPCNGMHPHRILEFFSRTKFS